MQRNGIHHLVVCRGKDVVGVISTSDLPRRGAESRTVGTVTDAMSASVVTASPKTTLREAANLMRGNRIGCLPVVEAGKVVGIVTTSDLLDLVGRGAERPVARSTRWTLKDRGPRSKRQKLVR
jgi:acetoin utilization protein AcuB